ncbi:unnamed protein product [Lampetra planeri]
MPLLDLRLLMLLLLMFPADSDDANHDDEYGHIIISLSLCHSSHLCRRVAQLIHAEAGTDPDSGASPRSQADQGGSQETNQRPLHHDA